MGPRTRAPGRRRQGYEARFITQTAKYDRQILMLWGPQSDLARDPALGPPEEVYGEDAFFNGTMAVAFIKGLQGDDPKYWQAAALLKHFLANSNEDHRNVSSSDFDDRLFWEYYSVPFRMGFLEGGARSRDGLVQRVERHDYGRSIPFCAASCATNGASRSSRAMAERLSSWSIRGISIPTRKRPWSRA